MVEDYLSHQIIDKVYKNLDLKEFLATAVHPEYDGLCTLRPSVEEIGDRYLRDLHAGGTILKYSHFDREYPMFKVISSSSDYADDFISVPFTLLQQTSMEDFRPWPVDSVVRYNVTDAWEAVVDYAKGQVVTQDLNTSQINLRKFEDITNERMYRRYGNVPRPTKGHYGVRLNPQQAEAAGLPAGVILPYLSVHSNVDGFVFAKLHGTDLEFKYGELEFVRSKFFRMLYNREVFK